MRQGFCQMIVEIERELCVGAVVPPKSMATVRRGHRSHREPQRGPSPDVHAFWGLPTPWPLKDIECARPGQWGWSLQNPRAKGDTLMISDLSTFLPGSPPQMGGCFSTSDPVCVTSLVSE